jgi:type I restriction enzyme S subunit
LRKSTVSANTNINQEQLKILKIALPSTNEQEQIAEILSTCDRVIELKKKLVEEKIKVKKWFMQTLLTGMIRVKDIENKTPYEELKKRFIRINSGEIPEGYKRSKRQDIFPEDWQEVKLRNIASIHRGASPRPIGEPRWFDDNSEVGWVRISDVTASSKTLLQTAQRLSEQGIKKSRSVLPGKIIMSICATVGKPIITGFEVCIHDGFVVFENLAAIKDFFYYLLEKSESIWSKYGQTGSQTNLNTTIVGNERMTLPQSQSEQIQIAEILSTADKEINLLNKDLEQWEIKKKSLMQLLLTGIVRVSTEN